MKLIEGMTLYHESYVEVPEIDLGMCVAGKDFGRGFYVTSSYEQACSFVRLSVRRAIRRRAVPVATAAGAVSAYILGDTSRLSVRLFHEADEEWLHLIAANRDGSLFPELAQRYASLDVIGGKIANDRTAQTLQFYLAGAYGIPGEPEADGEAIRTLLPNRLQDQFCFKSQKAIAALTYVGSETIEC